jgi:hypothetical protein
MGRTKRDESPENPAPPPQCHPCPRRPSLQIDLEGDWRRYTRLLPKDCAVLGVVTIAGDDYGALVRLAWTGALVKVTGGEVTMLNQNRVPMKLELLERKQYSPVVQMVEVGDCPHKTLTICLFAVIAQRGHVVSSCLRLEDDRTPCPC